MYKYIILIVLICFSFLIYCISPEKEKTEQNLNNWWQYNAYPNWSKTCHDRGNRIVCIITRPEKDGVDMLVCYPDSCNYFDQETL